MAKVYAEETVRNMLEQGLAEVDATYVQYDAAFENPLNGFDPTTVDRRERVVLFGWFAAESLNQFEEYTAFMSSTPNVVYVQLPLSIEQLRQAAESIKLE